VRQRAHGLVAWRRTADRNRARRRLVRTGSRPARHRRDCEVARCGLGQAAVERGPCALGQPAAGAEAGLNEAVDPDAGAAQRDRVPARRGGNAGRRPRADRPRGDPPGGRTGHPRDTRGMLSSHRQHVGVATEVRAHLHMATLSGLEPAVEEDSLRAREAPASDHVPHVDVGRRAHHRCGIAEDVPVPPPSDADRDRHDPLPARVDAERGWCEADEVVDSARDDRVEEGVLNPLCGGRGGREQEGGNEESGPAHQMSNG